METRRYQREKLMLRLAIRCGRSIEEIEAKSAMLKRWMQRRVRRTRAYGNEYQVDNWLLVGDVRVQRDSWVGFPHVWLYVSIRAFRNSDPAHREILEHCNHETCDVIEYADVVAP